MISLWLDIQGVIEPWHPPGVSTIGLVWESTWMMMLLKTQRSSYLASTNVRISSTRKTIECSSNWVATTSYESPWLSISANMHWPFFTICCSKTYEKQIVTVATHALAMHLFCPYITPQVLLSNNRAEFHNMLSAEICSLYNIKQTFTMTDQPSSNWLVGYLDFSKAFDRVSHRRLLSKVKAHDIGGKILEWIRGCLTSREQRVQINGKKSEWGNVTSGVPQESLLKPLEI